MGHGSIRRWRAAHTSISPTACRSDSQLTYRSVEVLANGDPCCWKIPQSENSTSGQRLPPSLDLGAWHRVLSDVLDLGWGRRLQAVREPDLACGDPVVDVVICVVAATGAPASL